MESRYGLFRNSVSFGARYVHGLCLMHHSLKNHFGSSCRYFSEEAQEEARFDLFGDSANLDARQVHDLQAAYHMLRNQFGRTQWNS
jgi:hypothetical protein